MTEPETERLEGKSDGQGAPPSDPPLPRDAVWALALLRTVMLFNVGLMIVDVFNSEWSSLGNVGQNIAILALAQSVISLKARLHFIQTEGVKVQMQVGLEFIPGPSPFKPAGNPPAGKPPAASRSN